VVIFKGARDLVSILFTLAQMTTTSAAVSVACALVDIGKVRFFVVLLATGPLAERHSIFAGWPHGFGSSRSAKSGVLLKASADRPP
jgi:hypothetical protein